MPFIYIFVCFCTWTYVSPKNSGPNPGSFFIFGYGLPWTTGDVLTIWAHQKNRAPVTIGSPSDSQSSSVTLLNSRASLIIRALLIIMPLWPSGPSHYQGPSEHQGSSDHQGPSDYHGRSQRLGALWSSGPLWLSGAFPTARSLWISGALKIPTFYFSFHCFLI